MSSLRFNSVIFTALVLALASWSSSSAADLQGDEMLLFQKIPSVFSASKYEQKVTEAPSSVSIVTAEEIKKYGYRTLSDILRSLRSFHITYDRTIHQAGVRGFNRPGDTNSRFLLLIDGLRLNDSIFGAASVDTLFILDVDLIDRIEVIRGPSSSLYGTSAFFGVINVITKRGRDLKGVEISGAAGSQETYTGRLSYGDRFQTGTELLLSGTRHESEGDDRLYIREFDAPETNHGIAEDADEDKVSNAFGKFSLGDFTLEGGYVEKEKKAPTAPFGTLFNDPRNKAKIRQWIGQLKYESRLANQLDVLARLGYNYYAQDADYVYDYSPTATPFIVINKDVFRGEWWDAEFRVGKQLLDKHRILFGGEYRNNFRQDQKNYDLDVYLNSQESSESWALFAQDEFRISGRLILNLGVRYDHYDTFGDTVNPRLALIYNLRDETSLKLLYGEAFRAPNAFEFYYHDGLATQKPNPDLDPEKIRTYEVVCEHYFADRLRGVASGFYYEIEDLIDFTLEPNDISEETGQPLVFFDNLDEVEAWGIELEMEGHLDGGLEGRISYTFQEVENADSGRILSNSPKHLAKLNLIVPVWKDRISLGIEEQYTSRRKTVSRDEVGSYAVTNLTLFSRHLVKGLEASASVYNLFDKEYADPASGAFRQETIEQDGRLFRVKLTYLF